MTRVAGKEGPAFQLGAERVGQGNRREDDRRAEADQKIQAAQPPSRNDHERRAKVGGKMRYGRAHEQARDDRTGRKGEWNAGERGRS